MTIRHRSSVCFTSLLIVVTLLLSSLLVSARIPISNENEKRNIYIARSNGIQEERSHTSLFKRQKNTKKPEYVAHPAGDLICRPFGECESCPKDELDQPFCFPFGNRRLLHCIPSSSVEDNTNGNHLGEVPAWEACGKVIKKERQDFWEFVTANLLFLIVALTILWARTSALATEQYRQLAARIGIPSGGWV
ncbi:uncharacterized protein I206_101898 [Kwoniella pini CBS 10737]|uniref:PSI domain-containing protein n=1 Tax=Kwoniella pini CBS 10737 TaxID=1296096 RepID=A0A1B9HVD9_9TREE|nr:uncharacterized protein I206_07011 [Kwoniella pini CBS 10737]OCF47233.1 hypothetical protein I206_07011 [Kwoniella pini CBS 10737]